MTLSSTTTKKQYNGDGATTSFPTTFKFLKNADVKAIHRDAAGNDTTWVEGTDYTLTGAGNDSGGPLIATTAPAAGETLSIKRAAATTQEAALPLGGSFPSTSVEQAFDLLTMLVQQNSEELERALTGAEADPDVNLVLPSTTARASQFLAFAADGSVTTAAGTSANLGPVTGFIDTLLDDVDAATARATLDAAKTDLLNSGTTQVQVTGTQLEVLIAGVQRLLLSASQLTLAAILDADSVTVDDGAVGTPPLGFQSDLNTGLYLAAADRLGLTAGGVAQLLADVGGLYTSGATGGAQGVDSFNLKQLFVDGVRRDPVALPSQALSGTDIPFTSIRAGTNEIIIAVEGASFSTTQDMLLQLGEVGAGYATSGYVGRVKEVGQTALEWSAGARGARNALAGDIVHGQISLIHMGSNKWSINLKGVVVSGAARENFISAGSVTLAGELDRFKFTTVSGTGVYDAGNVSAIVK